MGLGLRRNKQKNEQDLEAVFGEIELPSFPGVILEALTTIRDPEASAAKVAQAIEADPGVTVRLLRLVNSVAYSPTRPVTNLNQAVAIAGLSQVESMLLAVGVNVALPGSDVEGLDQRRFWQAAARRGSIAKSFAGELHPSTAGESFTAGLLLDMAVPMLATAREEYRPLLLEWHGGGDDLHDMEQSSFGWTHDSVAAMLCAKWELPENIENAIGGHHGSDVYEAPPAVELAAPFREVEMPDVLDLVVCQATEKYGLTADHTVDLIQTAEEKAQGVAQLFH